MRWMSLLTENNGQIQGQGNHAVLSPTVAFPVVLSVGGCWLVGRDEGDVEEGGVRVDELEAKTKK